MRTLFKLSLVLVVLVFALPALAQANPVIAIGDSVTGSLTTEQPSQLYTLQAEAGQAVNITLSSDTFDAYLTLKDTSGNVLAENDDLNGTNSGFQGLVLPQASGYMLLVESYGQHNASGAEVGDYTLSVGEQQINHIEYSQIINGQLTMTDLTLDYVFSGQAGDVIVASQTSTDFDSYLRLLDATGTELISNDDSGGALDSLIGPYTLPSTGNYTLRVSSLSGDTAGAFTLKLSKTEIGSLTYNEPIEVSFAPSDTAKYFTFDGTSGDLISIRVDSNDTINTSLTLNDPYGSQVASDDDSGSGFDPEIYQQMLSTSGTYTVALQAVTPGTGKVMLTIKHTPPPTVDAGPQTLNFTDSQNARAVTFTAKAGETVRLNLHLTSGQSGSPSVTVMQGDSTLANASGSYISDLNFSFVTPSDGDVLVQITDYSYTTLSYEVSLAHATE